MSNQIQVFNESLKSYAPQFAAALKGSNVSPDKFMSVVMNAVANKPDILSDDVDRRSVYVACMNAASDGLVLDNKEAALVTFKGQCKYMPMVGGIIKLMLSSGAVSKVSAHVVYTNDEFEHIMGTDEQIIHKRPKLGVDRGDPIGVYAIAKLTDGNYQYAVLDKKEVVAIRAVAKSKDVWDGPFWAQQWEKSAIRRIAKRLPKGNSKLDSALAADDDGYQFDIEQPQATVIPAENTGPQETAASRAIKERAAAMQSAVDVETDDLPI